MSRQFVPHFFGDYHNFKGLQQSIIIQRNYFMSLTNPDTHNSNHYKIISQTRTPIVGHSITIYKFNQTIVKSLGI